MPQQFLVRPNGQKLPMGLPQPEPLLQERLRSNCWTLPARSMKVDHIAMLYGGSTVQIPIRDEEALIRERKVRSEARADMKYIKFFLNHPITAQEVEMRIREVKPRLTHHAKPAKLCLRRRQSKRYALYQALGRVEYL